jgi:hypothetical protein
MVVGTSATVTVATGTGIAVIDALPTFPSLVAIISAVPAATAVTSPVLAFTVATAGLLEVQTTARPTNTAPPVSRVVALACVVWPTWIELATSETLTVATGTGTTVAVALPLFPSLVAVITAVPGATAVTTPSAETEATVGVAEDQVTTRPVSTAPLPSRVTVVA